MIPYILETIAFQLVFLLVYDLFLKKETFFQWNRAYLLITFMLSLNLPWIKIEAFKTIIQPEALFYPDFLWQLNSMEFTVNPTEKTSLWESLSSYEWTFFIGFLLMSIWFVFKVYRIQRLRSRGTIYYYQAFTKVVVRESQVAFSFFNQIFLGDGIPPDKEPQIMAHELVHIRQWHSLDLLFFEVMRIVMWFNPMVYLYQNRMAELQEFIADSKVAKGNKSAQYQLLLSEAFRTQNLSFVNQFFKESLIKKRIVMLTRTKSKTILQLKYLLLLPIILGMLFYSSCERETNRGDVILETIEVGNIANLTEEEETKTFNRLINLSVQSKNWSYIIRDKNSTVTFKQSQGESFISGPGGAPIRATMQMESGILDKDFDIFKFDSSKPIQISIKEGPGVLVGNGVPFATVDKVPVFPGCGSSEDARSCFVEKVQDHIRKHFKYPQEAQELGIEGQVAVMFTIDEHGEITNIQKRGPHELLENEVERIIKRLPKMEPGIHDGKVVKVPFSLPINFKLKVTSNIDSEIPKFSKRGANWVPFALVDKAPIFPGCENASDSKSCFQEKMLNHIIKNFNYPKEAQEKGIEGRVAIMFTINENGDIENIEKRGPSPLLENEAERIVGRLPKMPPAEKNGKAIEVVYSIPIAFKLR